MFIEIGLLVVILAIFYAYNKKPDNYPPGFWGLPLIGYVPLDGKGVMQRIAEARKKLGDVILWRMGQHNVVFIPDYLKLKKLLASPEAADRPDIIFVRLLNTTGEYGIISSNGPHWQDIRRFVLRQFRDLGMGKSSIVYSMQEEARALANELDKTAGIPGPLPRAIKIALMNVAWILATNKRYAIDDPKLLYFEQLMVKITRSVTTVALLNFFPWIKYFVPAFITDKVLMAPVKNLRNNLYTFFKEIIDEHRRNLDRSDPKDFIDAYLIEMEKAKDDPNSAFTDQDLFETIGDLYLGSTETAVETTRYIFTYMAAFPEIQTKLQEELDAVLPGDSLPDEVNQNDLHYTRAVITETHRYASIFPSGVLRSLNKEVAIDGYVIPKDSIIPITTALCHKDPKYWANPDEFKPERHLNAKGEYVAPKEGFLPFGTGKRLCVGEGIAKMELIIFTATILKDFRFSAPPGKKINIKSPNRNALIAPCDHHQPILIERRK